ncbi:MAG: helix-turn-helix transcriptional regulator [Verrucomicrobiota bacterium]
MKLQDSPITEEDFRAVVRILAEISSMDAGPDEKRNHLMREVALLLDTDTWLWGCAPLLEPGKQPVYVFQNSGGISDDRMALMLRAIEHPETGAMTARIAQEMISSGSHVTRLRQDIIENERFMSSAAQPFWAAAGIGPLILSLRPIPGHGTSVAGFYRPVSAPLFTAREARIAHIVLSEVSWLHVAGLPHAESSTVPLLPPRCRLILNQLVRGRPRKEIAADLGISVHTVNDHLKRIFRHFDVHSQAQLIARFRCGDGNDSAE